MSSNILIAIITTSIIALAYFIAVIIFIVWKCKSKDKKHEKKLTKKSFSAQPTILKRHPPTLMQIMLNKKTQLHYSRRPLVYTLPMPKQAPINKQQIHSKKKKQPEKVWPAQNSIPTFGRTFVWRPIENESGHEPHEDSQKNKGEEEQRSSFSDRQRKPHMGSIRHLPSDL